METGAPDLFATKGLEYMLVIVYLLLLAAGWRLLRGVEPAPAPVERRVAGRFILPERYCFHQGHAWAVPEGEDTVVVGIDDFTYRVLGKPHAVELPEPGTHLRQGGEGWKLELDSTTLAMPSPVSGEVIAVNPEIARSPGSLCSDPYDRGWLLKVRVPEQRRNRRNLLCGMLAEVWMEEQLRRLRVDVGLILPEHRASPGCDGGFILPPAYCFHQGHTWAAPGPEDRVRVGVDQFVGWLLGPPSGLDLPREGRHLSQGERGWSITVDSKRVPLMAPVDGEVVAVNEAVLNAPGILCTDPYDRGWLLEVHVPDLQRNRRNLLCDGMARAWMEHAVRDLRSRASAVAEPGLGRPERGDATGCPGFARMLAPGAWTDVAGELLSSEH